MKNLIKIILVSLFMVMLIVGITIATVPSLRNALTSKLKGESPNQEVSEMDKELQWNSEAVIFQKYKTLKQIENFVIQIGEREELLIEKENRMQVRVDRINEREKALIEREAEISKMMADISRFIPLISETEKKNIKKLAKMFETMSAETATPLFNTIPDDILVNILYSMKPRNSAKLLGAYANVNAEAAKRSALLTEKLQKLVVQ